MSEAPPTLPAFDGIPDPLSGATPALPPLPSASELGPSRTRAELGRARALALLLSLGWLAGQLPVLGLRHDIFMVPAGYLLAFGGAPLVAGAVCLLASVSAGRLGVGARTGLLALLALLAPFAFVLGASLGPVPYAGGRAGDFKDGLVCFHIAVAWTLLPLLLAGFALRGTFVGRSRWRSAALGSGAGLLAAVVSTLHCPVTGALHVGLAHGGAIFASALLGAFVLSRATRA